MILLIPERSISPWALTMRTNLFLINLGPSSIILVFLSLSVYSYLKVEVICLQVKV